MSYPASCEVTYHVAYLPVHADEGGWGRAVEAELLERISSAARDDPWLADNPPAVEWATDVPATEVSSDEPIVQCVLDAAAEVSRPDRIAGLDSWHNGATFTRFAGTPSVCFGPGDIEAAHTIDECVPVDDLVDCAKTIALTARRFCGEAPAEGSSRAPASLPAPGEGRSLLSKCGK